MRLLIVGLALLVGGSWAQHQFVEGETEVVVLPSDQLTYSVVDLEAVESVVSPAHRDFELVAPESHSLPFTSLSKLLFGAGLHGNEEIQYAYGYSVPQEPNPKITQVFHLSDTAKRTTTVEPLISDVYPKYFSTPSDIKSLPQPAVPKASTLHPPKNVSTVGKPLPPEFEEEPQVPITDLNLPPVSEFKSEPPSVSKDLPHDAEPPVDPLIETPLLLPTSSQTTEPPHSPPPPTIPSVEHHPPSPEPPVPVSNETHVLIPLTNVGAISDEEEEVATAGEEELDPEPVEMDAKPEDLPVPPADVMSSGSEEVVTTPVEPEKHPLEVLAGHEEQLVQPKATLSPTPEPMKLPPFTSVAEAEETDIKSHEPAAAISVDCLQNTDCNENEVCMDEICVDGCVISVGLCVGNAVCVMDHHAPTCVCPDMFTAVALPNGGNDCMPVALMVGAGGHQGGRRPSGISGRRFGSHLRPLTPIAFHRGSYNYRPLAGLSQEQLVSQERITSGVSSPISSRPLSSRPISSRPISSRPISSRPFDYDRQSTDPCLPNPCGENTRCSLNDYGIALCRCIDGYVPMGHTINGCKPQCVVDDECPDEYRCRSQKCVRVCVQGACGVEASCKARNHRAICSCPSGYRGDPKSRCLIERPEVRDPPADLPIDPCNPSPCGINAECRARGERPICSCPIGYEGDPLTNCRRGECIETTDCPSHLVCQRLKCVNPCDYSTCGALADCRVKEHQPICSCPRNYVGNALQSCRPFDPQELCNPSPCGSNTHCKVRNDRAVCSCFENYQGDPLTGCRPDCVADGDCPYNMACKNNICVNPCREACGENAYCEVVNSRPVCSCPEYYQGEPYNRCYAECTAHDDCPNHQACLKLRCVDPCEGACGSGANCKVENHKPICSCPKGYTGHPFESCRPFTSADLCNPNPCGSGADCTPGFDRKGENRPVCTCPVGYIGNPLVSCSQGECQSDSQCSAREVCHRYKCTDPCYTETGSVCGDNAICVVKMHKPVCSCPRGYSGDARDGCYPGIGNYAPGRGRGRRK